jgi:hypothetical protein
MLLICGGLITVLVAISLGEIGFEPRAEKYLELMLYGGAALCAVGAVLFTFRVMLARRRLKPDG